MIKYCLLTCAFCLNILVSFAGQGFRCTIKGEVIGRDSKTLILVKATDIKLVNKQVITIKDHKFEFVFDVKDTEAYKLIFEDEYDAGAFAPIVFFPVSGTIIFTLYPQNQTENDEVNNGELNKAYKAYRIAGDNKFRKRQFNIYAESDSLRNIHDYYNPVRDSLIKIITTKKHSEIDRSVYMRLDEMRKTGDEFTTRGKLVKNEQDILNADRIKWEYGYIDTHCDILSYYLIWHDALAGKGNAFLLKFIEYAYPVFAAKYPLHPYTTEIADLLNGYKKISVGEPLIEISLPDLSGKMYNLTELAKGKITLIDFWGSWCGPCISATRSMAPVYAEFKDKGFNIIGIAKEYKSTNNLKIALKREKYPWMNLVELDDKHQVWNKYGISNSTGMMVLVDKEGKIIAVDPTADVVRKAIIAGL